MLVEIKNEIIAKELVEKGFAKEISPLLAYYKDELRCHLEWLSSKGKLTYNDIDIIIEKLSYEWLDIYFDDIVKQIESLVSKYLEEINKQ